MVSTQEQFEQVQAVKKSINTASEEVKNQAMASKAWFFTASLAVLIDFLTACTCSNCSCVLTIVHL